MKVLKVFQMFDLLRFVNVDVPANTNAFMDIFSGNALDFVPSPPEIDETREYSELEWQLLRSEGKTTDPSKNSRILLNTELQFTENESRTKKNTCELHEVFIQRDMKCYVLNNVGNLFIELITNYLAKIVALLMMWFTFSKKKAAGQQGCLYRFFLRINRFLGFAFLVNTLGAFEIDLVMSAFVNSRSLWVYPFKLWINSVLAVGILILYANLAKKLIIKSYFLEKFRERYGIYPMTREDIEDEKIERMKDELNGETEKPMIESVEEDTPASSLEKPSSENKYMKRMQKKSKLKSTDLKEKQKIHYFDDLMVNADKDAKEAGLDGYDRTPHYYKTQRAYDDHEIKGWEFLREEISPKTSFKGGMINEMYLLRDLVLCAVILCFMNSPKMQFLPLIPIYGFFAFFINKHKPFKRNAMNKLCFLNEIGYMMLAICLASLDLFKKTMN